MKSSYFVNVQVEVGAGLLSWLKHVGHTVLWWYQLDFHL